MGDEVFTRAIQQMRVNECEPQQKLSIIKIQFLVTQHHTTETCQGFFFDGTKHQSIGVRDTVQSGLKLSKYSILFNSIKFLISITA